MRHKHLPYDPKLKHRARSLRKAGNLAEVLLWQQLRRRQMRGHDFHRQRPIGHYIVDFYCPPLQLAIEIDGASHVGREAADQKRQQELKEMGVAVLRFLDADVRNNLRGVLRAIEEWIVANERRPR
ncbi:MAG: endonuclease domain-containing protein [candidate division Zixibacteria bacterium]|nr:endonuclease domain-containing protein [candidate division Zixibacteria bacterium]